MLIITSITATVVMYNDRAWKDAGARYAYIRESDAKGHHWLGVPLSERGTPLELPWIVAMDLELCYQRWVQESGSLPLLDRREWAESHKETHRD